MDTLESPGDYQPISLINFTLKIISKLLATQLGKIINRLVDIDQTAFLKGRCILENIALAKELIFSIHKRRFQGILSPLLFVLVTNVLCSMFSNAIRSKILVGVP